MVFEKLHAARRAVVPHKTERRDEREAEPSGRKFLDRACLILSKQREQDDRADGRQPRDDRKQLWDVHCVLTIKCTQKLATKKLAARLTKGLANRSARRRR